MLATTGARSRPPVMVESNIYSPVTSVVFHPRTGSIFNLKEKATVTACAPRNERRTVVFRVVLRRFLWLEVRFPVRADYGLRAVVFLYGAGQRGRVQLVFIFSQNCWKPFTGRGKDEARLLFYV